MAEYEMEGGVGTKLEVFEDKVIIYSFGLFSQKLKNTKTIPYASIIAIDFRKSSSLFPGYIKFNLPHTGVSGGIGDLFWGEADDNRFDFSGQDELAENIKNYIEKQIIAIQKR
jgi:hypothetical protein